MYSQGELLQANATVIAGVLIFLTVTRFSNSASEFSELVQRWFVLSAVLGVLILLMISIVAIPLSPDVKDGDDAPSLVARILFIAGIGAIIVAVVGIMRGLNQIDQFWKRLWEPKHAKK
jgi:ABC-type Na+ efflux pump permease subunit